MDKKEEGGYRGGQRSRSVSWLTFRRIFLLFALRRAEIFAITEGDDDDHDASNNDVIKMVIKRNEEHGQGPTMWLQSPSWWMAGLEFQRERKSLELSVT